MKNKFLHKPISLMMILLMFFSSIGFSVDIHFCGDELQSYSFFGKAEACEMMKEKRIEQLYHSCCENPKKKVNNRENKEKAKGNCCHNESLVIDNCGGFESPEFSLEQFQQVVFVEILLDPNFSLFPISKKQNNFAFYIPPPIIKDIPVLHQVFLI
mgnify:CR=1 FL=1